MNEKIDSSKNNWILIVLLSSPVMVSVLDMFKEAFIKKKKPDTTVQLARLEAALVELAAQRKIQEAQPIAFQQQHIPQSYPMQSELATQTSPNQQQMQPPETRQALDSHERVFYRFSMPHNVRFMYRPVIPEKNHDIVAHNTIDEQHLDDERS